MVLEENMAVKGGGEDKQHEQEEEEDEEEEEEEAEYESDPEEAALSLAMRRREASDDEEAEGEGEEVRERRTRIDPRVEIGSDGESDGQGGVAVYDDEESEIEEEEEEVEEEGEVEEEEFEERGNDQVDIDAGQVESGVLGVEFGGDEQRSNGEQGFEDNKDLVEGEKKENEPFAVPTAGAFYMHDDRFRESGGGRHRRTPGGRKLWESKDDRKWGHDKFEEFNLQEKQYDKEGRTLKGQFRRRGKSRGPDRQLARGNKPRTYDGRGVQNQTVRSVRGRGPRRYEPTKNSRETSTQSNLAGRSFESTSNNSGRVSTSARTSNVQSDAAPFRKHVFASSLNSASPPFYPSGSANQDISQTQKRELAGGNGNKNLRPSVTSENKIPTSQPATFLRGKNVADVVDKLYYDEAPNTFYGKFNNLQLQSSGQSPIVASQSPQIKPKGRGLGIAEQSNYQSSSPISQGSRVSQQSQMPAVHQRPVQNTVQSSFRASSQQLGQHLSSASQASSPPKASPTSSSEPGEVESPPGSSKSRTALVGKGKTSAQGNGRGSFLYNGAQVIGASGNMGVPHGDPNFPGTPALLQVMQFGGQHPGGLGVPAVGMALPGYVAQPGFGNNEMTWVPVLAGAAGALGASYCPPYLAVDGGYYSRPTGQTSSSGVSSKETNTNKPNNVSKPAQRSELVNDEFGQRQNKPRRYSEMNFGQ